MFNIYIMNKDSEIPKDDICYLIGKDGVYIKKKVGLVSSIVKLNGISFLEKIDESIEFNVEKIPEVLFRKILSFFKEVYDKYRAEVAAIIFYNPISKKYKIKIPSQEVSGASVSNYEIIPNFANYIKVGTIHSHANMSAFHSTTDINDESNFDGFHFTIGHIKDLERNYCDIVCSLVSNGRRIQTDPSKYIEGIIKKEDKNVVEKASSYIYVSPKKDNLYYVFFEDFINTSWMNKVKEKEFNFIYNYGSSYKNYKYIDGKMQLVDTTITTPVTPVTPVTTPTNRNNTFVFDGLGDDETEEDPCLKCNNYSKMVENYVYGFDYNNDPISDNELDFYYLRNSRIDECDALFREGME